MRLVRTHEAARLLGVDAQSLRNRRRGEYVEIFGFRLKAYPMDLKPNAEFRYDADEIQRLLTRLGKAR